ncbi:penicillin acylase family protein [Pseudoalteromonas piscicida]|uniref:penicillin acylase family protein n=1 Tax=Pseudoalteromonas piscicida TaxID=43662 RepID=UPI0032C02D8E
MGSVLKRFVLLLLIMLGIALTYIFTTFKFDSGKEVELRLQDSHGSLVSLSFSNNMVTAIQGETDLAAFFGVGYAHARDRLWQLEVQRRFAKGELSAVFGEDTVTIDAQMRALGLYHAAEKALQSLSPQAQNSLKAYAAGINYYLAQSAQLPPEFVLLDVYPDPWQPLDTLAMAKLLAYNLSDGMWQDLTRFSSLRILDKQAQFELFYSHCQDAYQTLASPSAGTEQINLASLTNLHTALEQQRLRGGQYVGSNAWAVAAKHTQSGHAIVSGDPHLGLKAPSPWYAVSVKGDKIDAAGMSLTGIPVVIFGQNKQVAWTATNMMADTQDLQLERINPQNRSQYWYQGQWQEFSYRTEYIAVRAQFPEALRPASPARKITIRETLNGPVINDVFGISDTPMSLRWTALLDRDTSYDAFYQLNYARNWQDFRDALGLLTAPALNFLYGDIDGLIGYQAAGLLPRKTTPLGLYPVADDGVAESWQSFIPFTELPSTFNPDSGILVSANNRITNADYPYYISCDWAPDFRKDRITQLLEEKINQGVKLTAGDMQVIQTDEFSADALVLRTYLSQIEARSETQRQAIDLITSWDGQMSAHSNAATVFYVWAKHIRNGLFGDDFQLSYRLDSVAEQQWLSNLYRNTSYTQVATALTEQADLWCTKQCNEVVLDALDSAIAELRKQLGSDMSDWLWGDIHQTVYFHDPFSRVDLLKPLFEIRNSTGGGPNTIKVSVPNYVDSVGYERRFGVSHRQIMVVDGSYHQHLFSNSTSQTGNPLSFSYSAGSDEMNGDQYQPISNPSSTRKVQ